MPGGTHLTRVHVTRSDFSILASYIRVREQVGSATNRGHLAKAGALRDDGANTVFVAFHLQPHKVLCVRLAVEMGLFDSLPPSAPFTLQDLIEYAGADPEFTGRVDSLIRTMSLYVAFFNTTSFVTPYDPMSSPYAFSEGVKNIDFFIILYQDPKAARTFNEARTTFKDPLGDFHSISSLNPGEDGILLVDIAGGNCQSVQSIISTNPEIKGRFIPQYLPVG
ncbi:hypothetical protein BDV35DRAFT_388560 [Aspergillus flavus]|uniref:DNA, SC113 n=6 Tax=Aspergillus subgen. Circumdati TaxID=2720871 RepID=Q2U5E4_ASPOR|nr:unnamed protein product [Aspergillus oryzae RIB40]EIT82632.1 hypothetical protein Ao3042_00196 [Aspergillus oryzae 3.042]KAB8251169.1 hypothetical protein BDV35DRAFT_388560 [Aspergillus flavus]KDE76123.1 hypothetical protein AO1008_01809 [Aspergillus oryzae 100-8]OOO05139.1 hypothetical protein OAory_01066550 [Aspergillus oryzae]BAE63221.1 unnamed protein product [Aspergillus oryzae RIB40]|eukprot:EIT82632.1 hypothetical protein Ao3042_00196 [Aspergillus oryzae 3.042]